MPIFGISCFFGLFLLNPPQITWAQSVFSKTHTYYIAADEVLWNYTPRGRNLAGVPHAETGESNLAANVTYLKSIYREYTDDTFTTLKPRPPAWQHLGILGPLIRAEVGDTIRVVFKNNTKFRCTMHPHGLFYDKDSEGALYADNTPAVAKKDDAVPPGGTHTYIWSVPESAGPAHGDGTSVLWMYHSHFIEGKDINSGLIGPIIITAKGASKPDGTPKDVDREFVTAFAIFDESQSWYFETNMARQKRSLSELKNLPPNSSNPFMVYTINGMIEGNLPMMTMKRGERVRWYLFATSNELDVHTPHWHGQTAVFNHMRTDTIALTPMSMAVADMVPENPGTWLFHCHINDHFENGMVALFTVLP